MADRIDYRRVRCHQRNFAKSFGSVGSLGIVSLDEVYDEVVRNVGKLRGPEAGGVCWASRITV